MTMRDQNYTDDALRVFASDLDEGEQTLLVTAGALPATFKDLDPALTSSDIARMIELVKDDDLDPKDND